MKGQRSFKLIRASWAHKLVSKRKHERRVASTNIHVQTYVYSFGERNSIFNSRGRNKQTDKQIQIFNSATTTSAPERN